MTGSSRRVLRARFRQRGGRLAGFDPDLVPSLWEWGVDRFQMEVSGRWRSDDGGRAFFLDRLAQIPGMEWFGTPYFGRYYITCKSLAGDRSTFGAFDLRINSIQDTEGGFKVKLHANPTRTLAHLWARFEGEENFVDLIARLRPDEFFQIAEDERLEFGLDANDNMLPDVADMRAIIGDDVFARFLPIYVTQLQRVCFLVLSSQEDLEIVGTTHILRSALGQITLNWSTTKVPQIETYFERFHPYAQSSVRHAASTFLAADHHVRVRTHPLAQFPEFVRDNDCFTVEMKITERRKLRIYAKTHRRIRFEVVRDSTGNYPGVVSTGPTERLLGIFLHERAEGNRAGIWNTLGELLAGPDHVDMADLGFIIRNVIRAFAEYPEDGATALTTLLEEGAISRTTRNRNGINRLVRAGLLEEVKARRKNLRGRVRRFSLTAPYRDLHALITNAIPPSTE